MKDMQIISRAQQGDFSFFSVLYDKYIDGIYRYVLNKTSDREVAEDITSEVFYSALNKIDTFQQDESASFKSWLYRIAHNKVVDFYRTHKTSQTLGEYFDICSGEDISIQTQNRDTLEKVLDYLRGIKKEQRQIILLRIWDDMSYSEISDITGKSVDNCKKIVSRVLKNISQLSLLFLIFLIII